jgi:hypothetical protein
MAPPRLTTPTAATPPQHLTERRLRRSLLPFGIAGLCNARCGSVRNAPLASPRRRRASWTTLRWSRCDVVCVCVCVCVCVRVCACVCVRARASAAFADLNADMDNAEAYVKYVVNHVRTHNAEDLAFFGSFVDKELLGRLTRLVEEPFARVSYTEAVGLLQAEIAKDPSKWEFPEVPSDGRCARMVAWLWSHSRGCGRIHVAVVAFTWLWSHSRGCGRIRLAVVAFAWLWSHSRGCGGVAVAGWLWPCGCGRVAVWPCAASLSRHHSAAAVHV